MTRILVIDDEAEFRSQLVRLFNGQQYECDHAGTDEEARRLARENAYSFIFVDLAGDTGNVGIDREAFCAELRSLNGDAVLVGMTGLVLNARQAFDLGKAWLDDFVEKRESPAAFLRPLREKRVRSRYPKRFNVALSYPGQQNALIDGVARDLAHELGRRRVFYAPYHLAGLAGPVAVTKLEEIYARHSDLVVAFLSAYYVTSAWCTQEWRAIQQARERGSLREVMLFRTDNTVAHFPTLDIAVDARDLDAGQIARMIVERFDSLGH